MSAAVGNRTARAPRPLAELAARRLSLPPELAVASSALGIVVLLLVVAVVGPSIVPYPEHVAGGVSTARVSGRRPRTHWFGTNELGQDVFSLVVAGSRISLLGGLAVVVIAAIVGAFIGAVAGYFGGWIDEVLMRFTDLMLTLPSLILAMAIAAALGPGIGNMVFAISMSWWPGYARLVRGEVMAKKEEIFVQAARAWRAGTRAVS